LRRQAFDGARVPRAVCAARDPAERHTFAYELLRLAGHDSVADGLSIERHLTRDLFEVAGAEQSRVARWFPIV
jgi:hypothetical protein